jgi:hypothetical protein
LSNRYSLVLDTVTGRTVFERRMPGPITDAVLAPDGRHVATVNGDGTIYILRLPLRAEQPLDKEK